MAYTDITERIALKGAGVHSAVIVTTTAVAVGDLLNFVEGSGVKHADQSDGLVPNRVAMEAGDLGDTILVAESCTVRCNDLIISDYVKRVEQYFCAAADVNKPLYLGEAGRPSLTPGASYPVPVGFMVSRQEMALFPGWTCLSAYQGLYAPRPAFELVAAERTIKAVENGKTFISVTDNQNFILPLASLVPGMRLTFIGNAADGGMLMTITPGTDDGIGGNDLAYDNNKTLNLTKATMKKGDAATIQSDGVADWHILSGYGVWAKGA